MARRDEGVTSLIGVDVGGTRIQAGAVAADGRILSRSEFPTEARRGAAAVLADLERAVRDLSRGLPGVRGVGVACAGLIHPVTGAVVYSPNLGWHDVPLAAYLARSLGVPVHVENDVRAAAWGEFRFGAGVGVQSLVAVFVGTGVGSGAVLRGELWRGAGNAAGEVGHTQVVVDGLDCPCGQHGCLEQYVSGSGFQRRLRQALAEGVRTRLAAAAGGEPERLTAAMLYASVEDADPLARRLWDDAVRYLTTGLANYVTLVNPELLILGGGVIERVPQLFDAVATGVPKQTTVLARSVRIERPQLGAWSGVVGVADLAAG